METSRRAETAYVWTVRGLYAIAIGLNAYYLLKAYAETPEGVQARSLAGRVSRRISQPWRDRKWWIREKTAVVLEAWNVVEQATEASE